MRCILFKRMLIMQNWLFNIIELSLVLRFELTAKIKQESSKRWRCLTVWDRRIGFHKECRSDMKTFLVWIGYIILVNFEPQFGVELINDIRRARKFVYSTKGSELIEIIVFSSVNSPTTY